MKKEEKILVELCFLVFGNSDKQYKKMLKKIIGNDEFERVKEKIESFEIDIFDFAQQVKKNIKSNSFWNFPAVKGFENLFFVKTLKNRFGVKIIEAKDKSFVEFEFEGDENPFYNPVNYLLAGAFFTLNNQWVDIEDIYRFITNTPQENRIRESTLAELKEQVEELAEKLVELEVAINFEGKTVKILEGYEKDSAGNYRFFCTKLKNEIGNKLISINRKMIGQSKIESVLKKIQIIKEIRNFYRYKNQFSNTIILNRISQKIDEKFSEKFLKKTIEELKKSGLLGDYKLTFKGDLQVLTPTKQNKNKIPVTAYYGGHLQPIAYYVRAEVMQEMFGVFYSKVNYHILSGEVRFDDKFIKLDMEKKQKIEKWVMENIVEWIEALNKKSKDDELELKKMIEKYVEN